MESLSTKERILKEALNLFSVKGYEGVSVAQIASAVGIKPPSLYKHFQSKQEIFEAILKEMTARYRRQAAVMEMNGLDARDDKGLFMEISEVQLIEMGKSLFRYFLHDAYMSKFRRMLALGQYHDPALSNLYIKQFVDEPLAYQGMIFGLLIQGGVLLPEPPQIMALHFYAPIFLLLTLCDCHPEREIEAIEMVEQHIRQFNRLYQRNESSR